jgi:hypothetical protein
MILIRHPTYVPKYLAPNMYVIGTKGFMNPKRRDFYMGTEQLLSPSETYHLENWCNEHDYTYDMYLCLQVMTNNQLEESWNFDIYEKDGSYPAIINVTSTKGFFEFEKEVKILINSILP